MILKLLSAAAAVLALTAQQSTAQFTVALPDRAVTVEYSEGNTIFKGAPVYGEPGQPSLPGYKLSFILPEGVDPKKVTVTIENSVEEVVKGTFVVNPALPPTTRGEIIWPSNKNILDGMDMSVYGKDSFFPSDFSGAVSFGKMRQYQLVSVSINPFKYNPVTHQLKKITGGTLTLHYPQETSTVKKSSSAVSATKKTDGKTEKSLRKKVVNPDVIDSYSVQTQSLSATSTMTLAATQAVSAAAVEGYVIITTNAIVNASTQLQNLITQKRNAGFNVILATENTWGGGTGDDAAENIRRYLRLYLTQNNIQYVLLIGNPHPATGDVPMKMSWPRFGASQYQEAPTDFYYAELSGDWDVNEDGIYGQDGIDFGPDGGADQYAEVAVGRIPFYGSITDLDKILAKSTAYANETSRGWRKSVLLPMVPSDQFTPGFCLGEEIKSNYLSTNNWKSFRVYNMYNNYSSQFLPEVLALTPTVERTPTNYSNVEDAWKKNPFGLAIWWTHGSETVAADIFSSPQAANLNDKYPSMTFQVSCTNGSPEYSDNLGYSLLLNGAVSTICASRVSWYMGGQNSGYLNSGTNCGMGYTYGLYMTSNGLGTADALNEVKTDVSTSSIIWMNHLVFNVYGCPDLALNIDNTAPTECRTSASSPSRIQICWFDNSTNETGYRIERSTGSASFAEIATVGANVSSYNNDGLSANTKYRYRVRSYFASGTSDYSNIDSTTTYTNIALGKTATASSQQTGYEPANGIDNHANSTRWSASSATMPQWFKVDLGTDLDLSGCEIVFQRAGTSGDCNDFIISSSSDNVTWSEQINRSTNTNTAQTQAYSFQTSARYIRISISDAPGTYNASIYEFRVFGQTVPSNPKWHPFVAAPNEQLRLHWTPSAGATNYRVYQSQLGQPRFVIASELTDTSFVTTGLIGGKNYIFSVVAFNSAGHSTDMASVAETWITVPTSPPNAPLGLSIIANGSANGFILNWNDNSINTESFEIERRVMNTSTWSLIASSPFDTPNFSDETTNNSISYEYRVRAYNSAGYSNYSNIVNTLIPPGAPAFITTTYNAINSTITLTWSGGTTQAGFNLERSTDNNTYEVIATLGPNVTSYTNTSVGNDHYYVYKMYAYNSYGNSDNTYTSAATTPNTPSNLSASLTGNTEVFLSWTDNSNSENGFLIEQAVGTGTFLEIGMVWSNTIEYTISNLSASTTYKFRIRAYNSYSSSGSVTSGYSNTVSIATPAPIPAVPTNLTATGASSSQINLSWNDNANNEDGYIIQSAPAGTTFFLQIASVGANVKTYSHTGLTAGTTYEYIVRSFNSGGNSAFSNTATGTTLAAPVVPSVPTNLVATVNSRSQITLTWTDNSSNESGFYIERATASAGPFTQIASVGANVKTFVNTGLTTNTAYWYRIRAYNANGNSAYTATVTATTQKNLTTSGTASAQSEQTGNLAANAKDNSTTTRWAASSGTMPQWWKIDLGSSKAISEVEIMFERVGTTGDCNDFKIETSTDNNTWTSRIDKTTNTNTVQTQSYPFSATARYVRITFSDAPGTYYASMFEFRVFGK